MPIAKLNSHYQLPKKCKEAEPFRGEMASFAAWATQPIQLDRERYKAAGSRTWENQSTHIHLFLGFLHHHQGIAWPTMACFKDAKLYAAYIAFHHKKEASISSFTNQISTAHKVLTWFKTTATATETLELQQLGDWLSNVRTQLQGSMARRRLDPVELEQEDRWMPAEEVVVLLDSFRLEVLSRVPQEGLCNPHTARLLHDAVLSSCMFGYLPPIRLSCIRSLQSPGTAAMQCLHPDCKEGQRCKGNRLEWRGDLLWICLPHHKNAVKHGSPPIDLQLPAELQHLVALYLAKARPVLTSSGCMFIDQKGRPMQKASNLSHYWEQLLKRLGSRAMFPPNRLRHIFVDERRSRQRVEGPDDTGASQVMGNSVRQWDKVYDLRAFQRETTAAVESMPGWRKAMLEQSQAPPRLQGAQEEGDSSDDGSFHSC